MKRLVFRSFVLLYFHSAHIAHGLHKEFNKKVVKDYFEELVRDDGSRKMAKNFHEKLIKSVDCEAACKEGSFVNEGWVWNSADEKGRKKCLESCKGVARDVSMDLFESVSGVLLVTKNERSQFKKELNRTNSLVRLIDEKQKASERSRDELMTFVLGKARKFATENAEYVLELQRSIADRYTENLDRITKLLRKVAFVEESLLDFCKKSDVKRMVDSKAEDVKDQIVSSRNGEIKKLTRKIAADTEEMLLGFYKKSEVEKIVDSKVQHLKHTIGRHSRNDHTPVDWALVLAFACTLALFLYVKPNGKLLKDLQDRLRKQADDQRRESEEKSAAVAALEEKVKQQSAEDEKIKEELAKQKAVEDKLRGEVENQKRALEGLEGRISEMRRIITNVHPHWDIVSSSGASSLN